MHIVRRGAARLPLVATLLLVCAAAAAAQPPQTGATPAQNGQGSESNARRSMTAMRLADDEVVTLDGQLDEPFWLRAVPAADFIQIDPQNGRPATEPTDVRIVFDSDALYMGVTCFDSDPDGWLGFQRRRDEGLGADDRFQWTIDTFLDGRTGYFFEMNPSGLMADGLIGLAGQNRQWDGIWDARARRGEKGWTLEIKIPFRTLNFNPDNDTWGINFQRTVRRKNEESIWNGFARNQGVRRVSNAGLISGIRNVTQGRGLDIKPYGVLTSEAFPGRGRPSDSSAAAGMDLFYNPTPFLRANFTVNTDFAQTEVDQRQVNLTRYSLFFPEQRDFFLDGATSFDFASRTEGDGCCNNDGELIIPFFSRRIGLSADATPQKIDFGTKVTGQLGAQDVGLLHVRTGEEQGFTSEDFTVARIKRRMMRQSYVGAIYTRRDARMAGSEQRQTAGLDFSLKTSTFRGSDNLEVAGWLLHATRPGISSGNSAFGTRIDYPNDRWNAALLATEVQENFDPAAGYIWRRGYRRFEPKLEFQPRPRNHRYIRQITTGGTAEVLTDRHNQLITRVIDLNPLQVNLHSQDTISTHVFWYRERLDEPFQINRNITLPLGAQYDFTRYRFFVSTASRRMLAFSGRIDVGGFYSGTRFERIANVSLRLRPGYFLWFNGQWNNVKLPEGHFTTRLYRVNLETQFTPFVSLVNNVQYDTQSTVLGWQSRFRWILTPGNDLYVVYTHNWLDDPVLNRLTTLDRRAASKILYTYRF